LFGAGAEMFGFIPCLVAALLFAFAPMPVYYSRYFIHETLFVAATLGLILSSGRALQTNFLLPAALAGFCAALMLACKETAVIHFFALGLAAVIGWRFQSAEKIPPAQNLAGRRACFSRHDSFAVHLGRTKLAGAGRFVARDSQFRRPRWRRRT
jgi:predicted membrane-bound mannosyltransferase